MYHGAAAVPRQGVNEQGAGDQAMAACSSSNSLFRKRSMTLRASSSELNLGTKRLTNLITWSRECSTGKGCGKRKGCGKAVQAEQC